MDIREAILKAADFIESNPRHYSFFENHIPRSENEHGCALGWINYFQLSEMSWWRRVLRRAWSFNLIEERRVGCDSLNDFFYRVRMTSGVWLSSGPREAPMALRMYADAYYPAPSIKSKIAGIPESVRAIFRSSVTV